jgi:hypothetical protein
MVARIWANTSPGECRSSSTPSPGRIRGRAALDRWGFRRRRPCRSRGSATPGHPWAATASRSVPSRWVQWTRVTSEPRRPRSPSTATVPRSAGSVPTWRWLLMPSSRARPRSPAVRSMSAPRGSAGPAAVIWSGPMATPPTRRRPSLQSPSRDHAPRANTVRRPESAWAWMAASMCCGVGAISHQSTTVVVPGRRRPQEADQRGRIEVVGPEVGAEVPDRPPPAMFLNSDRHT